MRPAIVRPRSRSSWAAAAAGGKRVAVQMQRFDSRLDVTACSFRAQLSRSRRPTARALMFGALLVLGTVAVVPGCSQHRAPRPNAEESLPPSPQNDPDLPRKKSSLPGEEQLGTTLLVVLLLALAAGAAYLSFVVIPDAIN
ncbi:MAG: hypothetical protein U0610_31955 [bacterium]